MQRLKVAEFVRFHCRSLSGEQSVLEIETLDLFLGSNLIEIHPNVVSKSLVMG